MGAIEIEVFLTHLDDSRQGVGLNPEPGEERAAISLSAGAED